MPRKKQLFNVEEFFSHYTEKAPGSKSNIIKTTSLKELFRSRQNAKNTYTRFVGSTLYAGR